MTVVVEEIVEYIDPTVIEPTDKEAGKEEAKE